MTSHLRAPARPTQRRRQRPGRTACPLSRYCWLVIGTALVLVAGLLPALDPLAKPFGGLAVAHAATASDAGQGGSANSDITTPSSHPGPRLPLSDPIYPPIDAESATVAGGWRDGTSLLALGGAAQGQLDPLKLYDLTDVSTMVRIPALSTQACPGALQNLHVVQRSSGAPSQSVTYLCSGSPAENLHGNFPAGVAAFRVLAPAPGQPLTGETVGPLPAGSATNPDLADSIAYVRQGTTAHTDNSTFADSVTSMAMGFLAGDPVLLFHSEDPMRPGDRWTAYTPLDSSAVTDVFRRQLRGQDAPKRLHPIETTTAADDPANSLFTFYSLPTRSRAVDASHCGAAAPCFEYDWQQQSGSWTVGGYAAVIPEMVSLFLPDGRLTATVPDSAVGLGYPHGDPPAGGLEPWMVVTGGLVAPLSSALGQELFGSIWSPSHGSWSFRASLSKTARAALVTAKSPADAPAAPVPVSSAEFAYYTKTLGLPPSQFAVKDSYTADEIKDWVHVDPANLNSVIADGEQHDVVDAPREISTITTNPSTAANVVGVGMGVALRDGQYRPVLIEQTLPGLLGLRWLDSNDDATVQLFGQSYEGRLGRYRQVGRPSEAPPVNVPLNTRSATIFVGSAAAAEVVRSLPWTTITDQGYAVAQVGFGCYQQLADRSPVGPCVKAVAARLAADGRTWLFTPNSADTGQLSALRNSVLPLRDGTPDPNVTGLFGWQEWGQVADFMSQQGITDTVATYDLAGRAGGLSPAKQQLPVALQAKAILQNGKKFPFTNGGRDVLTPTEAGELFDAHAVDAKIADTTKDPGVRADIVETTKDVAALADAEVTSTPLSELRFSQPGVADATSLTTLNGALASLNQQRMALRAASWIWQEFRARAAQASVTTFGATVPAVVSRLTDAYPNATEQDVNVAVMNAFVLLHIDNDAILAALAVNQGRALGAEVLAKLAMRSLLDPGPASMNHACTSARVTGDITDLQWSTSYAGLWGYLQNCVRNTFDIPAPAAWTSAGAGPASDVVSAARRDVGSVVSSRYSVARGAKRANLLAEQVIAIDAAGFAQWAGTDAGWAPLKSGVNDSASRVMTLLAKIDPELASAVSAMVAVDAAGDDVASIRIGDLPDTALTSAFNFALDVWLSIARQAIRVSGLAGSIANTTAALLAKSNFDSAVTSLTSLFKEYAGDYRITDLDKLQKLLNLPAAAQLPGITFLNSIGSIGTIAAFFSLGLMIWRYTAGGGPVSPADIISVVSTVTTVISLSSHIIRLGAAAMLWGEKWDSYLRAADATLGLGETTQHNWKLLMSDENGYRSRVLAAKIALAAAKGELTKGLDLKGIIENAHFTISDDAADRLFADLQRQNDRLTNAFKVERAVQPLTTGGDALPNFDDNLDSRVEEDARNASSSEELRKLEPLRENNSGLFAQRSTVWENSSGPDLGATSAQLGDEAKSAARFAEYEALTAPSSESLLAEVDKIDSAADSPKDIADAVSVEVANSPSDPNIDDPVNEIKDKVAASLKNREVLFRTVGIAIGLAIQVVMALCDFVGGVFAIVLGILSLRAGGTAADRASAWLTITAGIAFALAGVLEFVGTALAAAVFLPLFAVALLILVVSLLVQLLQKKHPAKDDAALDEWIAPFYQAGLLERGWLSRNDLEAWHNNGWGMDTTLQQCGANSGAVTCLGRASTAPRRPLGRLVNVATQQCVGVKRPASDPFVPAATAEMGACVWPSYVDEQPSRGGHGAPFGWEVVQPYGSDTRVLLALIDPIPGLPAAAKCLLPGMGSSLTCPHDYTHGDGGASEPGIWTVEDGPAPGQFRLKDPASGMYLAATRDSQTPFLSNVPDSPYQLWALS